jgi:hypothetical protein
MLLLYYSGPENVECLRVLCYFYFSDLVFI